MGSISAPPNTNPSYTTITVSGLETESGGKNTSAHAAVTSPGVVSGTAFTPNAGFDTFVDIVCSGLSTAGSLQVTYGPTTGAENTWCPTLAIAANTSDSTSLYVPAGWKVIATVTGTGAAITGVVHRI